jgi:hypothetical protein
MGDWGAAVFVILGAEIGVTLVLPSGYLVPLSTRVVGVQLALKARPDGFRR